MTAPVWKLSANGRRGLLELRRAATLRTGRRGAVRAVAVEGVLDEADEMLVVVVTRRGALIRRSRADGRRVDVRELAMQLAGAEAAVEEVARAAPLVAGPQLTSTEATLLDD